jgi:hypothetical protein
MPYYPQDRRWQLSLLACAAQTVEPMHLLCCRLYYPFGNRKLVLCLCLCLCLSLSLSNICATIASMFALAALFGMPPPVYIIVEHAVFQHSFAAFIHVLRISCSCNPPSLRLLCAHPSLPRLSPSLCHVSGLAAIPRPQPVFRTHKHCQLMLPSHTQAFNISYPSSSRLGHVQIGPFPNQSLRSV